MKVRTITPPVKTIREFAFTESEAKLVKEIIGKFTEESLADHMDISEESTQFVQFNKRVDALFEQLQEAF